MFHFTNEITETFNLIFTLTLSFFFVFQMKSVNYVFVARGVTDLLMLFNIRFSDQTIISAVGRSVIRDAEFTCELVTNTSHNWGK